MTVSILSKLTKKGFRFNPLDLVKSNVNKIPHSCSQDSFYRYHTMAIEAGIDEGIIEKNTSDILTDTPIGHLQSVKYMQKSMRGSKYIHLESMSTSYGSTFGTYLRTLVHFNSWLIKKEFKIKTKIQLSNNTFKIIRKTMSFSSIEDLLNLVDDFPESQKDVVKIIREYLDAPLHGNNPSPSTMNNKYCAIMAYFRKNEIPLTMIFDTKKFDKQETKEDSELTLDELYFVLTDGKPSVMEKSLFLVKFQAGFDSSTLADRFNFDGLKQIQDYFGSQHHNSWDLEKCPVPLKHIRMKNGFQHTPFLERDAIVSIQKYLDWRISKFGSFGYTGPLYLNTRGNPLTSIWISHKFFKLAENAGLQKKLYKKQFKIKAHEVRDLLKSTLIDCGCKEYVADHVIGHMPKDSYEKQTKLYPETLRKEYSKASGKLNLFTKFSNIVSGKEDIDELKIKLNQTIKRADELLELQKSQAVTQFQDEFFAKQKDAEFDKLRKEFEELKKHVTGDTTNSSSDMEFCCVDCSTIHDKKQCPVCGSTTRRIFEQKPVNK